MKVEKNIPIPAEGSGKGNRGKWAVIRSLKVGESFAVPSSEANNLRQAVYMQVLKSGFKYTVRTMLDQVRCWRTE